jgi:hypothetical protein
MSSEPKKLQFGCYSVKLPHINIEEQQEEVVCKPLTQADYAEGWVAVLPKKRSNSTIYNWNVNLAQLPPHLWSKCHVKINKEGKPYYHRISDGIYTYNVSMTEYDDSMLQLNKEMSRSVINKDIVRDLYDTIKQHTSGWLVIKAKELLN